MGECGARYVCRQTLHGRGVSTDPNSVWLSLSICVVLSNKWLVNELNFGTPTQLLYIYTRP
jgi:hypothetical protein